MSCWLRAMQQRKIFNILFGEGRQVEIVFLNELLKSVTPFVLYSYDKAGERSALYPQKDTVPSRGFSMKPALYYPCASPFPPFLLPLVV